MLATLLQSFGLVLVGAWAVISFGVVAGACLGAGAALVGAGLLAEGKS